MKQTISKFGIGLAAMILALAFSAFTAPKNNSSAKLAGEKYWYEVDRSSQTILQNTPLYDYAEKHNVDTECNDEVMDQDCLRGFNSPQNTSLGAITASGDEQIKVSENP